MLSRTTQLLIMYEAIDFPTAYNKVRKAIKSKKLTITKILGIISALDYLECTFPNKKLEIQRELYKAKNALKRANHV